MMVEPEMPFNVAEMLQYPLNTIIACPFESGALLMVAIAVSDEVQTWLTAMLRVAARERH